MRISYPESEENDDLAQMPPVSQLDFHAVYKPLLSGGKELLLSLIPKRSNDYPPPSMCEGSGRRGLQL